MAIDLQKLEQKVNALLNDPNFVTEFEQWLESRNVSQNNGKPIVSGALPLEEFINEVERMQKLYSNSKYTAAEELRDRLSEQLDDIMRLGGNDR